MTEYQIYLKIDQTGTSVHIYIFRLETHELNDHNSLNSRVFYDTKKLLKGEDCLATYAM